MTAAAEIVTALDARAELGEGPVWDSRRGELVWVDILSGRVHFFDPTTSEDRSLEVGQPVGAVALRRAGGLVLAVRDGFAVLEANGEQPRLVADVESDDPRQRMNDGACDARGRFWAGTMTFDSSRPSGSLYRLDPDGRVERMITGLTTPNGIDWSLDGRTMYFIDSYTSAVDAFDFDPDRGSVSARRSAVAVESDVGIPDGMTVDAEGHIWVAIWGGGQVRRYAPDGRLVSTLDFPVSQVTSCAFGGSDLRTLYVTSARVGLDAAALASQPLAGAIFAVRTDVVGRLPNPFAG